MVIFQNRSQYVKLGTGSFRTVIDLSKILDGSFSFIKYKLLDNPIPVGEATTQAYRNYIDSLPPVEGMRATSITPVWSVLATNRNELEQNDSINRATPFTSMRVTDYYYMTQEPRLPDIDVDLPTDDVRDQYSQSRNQSPQATGAIDISEHQLHSYGLKETLTNLVEETSPYDLAVLSQVSLDDKEVFIPMLDFNCPFNNENACRIAGLLRDQGLPSGEWRFYNSGHSMHLYGMMGLEYDEYLRVLGMGLLLNQALQSDTVDSRWVGWSLYKGYSALRITHNQSKYTQRPLFVGYFNV